MPIVWECAAGKVCVTQLESEYVERNRQKDESTDSVVLRLALEVRKKIPRLANSTPYLVKTIDMPPKEAETTRDKWKLVNGTIDTSGK